MVNNPMPNSTSCFENTESDSGLSNTVGDLFQLIVQSVIFLFGVPGNCLILRVYWTKTLTTSTHVFIMGLAWADLAVSLLAVNRIYYKVASMAGHEVPEFTFIILALQSTAISTSIMMTAVIAADRYDCICRPQRRFFTHKRGKIAAWAAFVFSLVVSIPAYIPRTPGSSDQPLDLLALAFEVMCFVIALVMIALCYGKIYTTIKKHTKVGVKSTTRDCRVSRIVNNCSTRLHDSVFTNDEPNILNVASVLTFISKPCSSNAIDGSRIAQNNGAPNHETNVSTLGESGKRRASHPQSTLTKHVLVSKDTENRVVDGTNDTRQHQGNAGRAPPKADAAGLQRKTTRMLFITSVVFLLTWLPYWILAVGKFASYSDPVFHMILEQLSITAYVNNAVNPLIYGLANRRFRKDCKTIFSKFKFCKNDTN
ncbi:5-hydroxytryptamine receptor 1A-beta-like [Patiria miniata]|uniref:G-protein coupled receptors family 1 profile domain-containing protein n=1 Tax=Patiria miniata TaxID=46514 RepID=A0A913ZQ52_PATMI|nr:5-hydroxytryptamine receptor 1A-beta-like [Patiria miniata]